MASRKQRPAHMISRSEAPEYRAECEAIATTARAAGVPENDVMRLHAIKLASEVADAWARLPRDLREKVRDYLCEVHGGHFDRLERATRGSRFREVS